MRVRAVTIGWTVEWRDGAIANAGELAGVPERIREACVQRGIELQTVRLATQPFPEVVPPDAVVRFAQQLAALARTTGFDYVSMGPARPGEDAWIAQLVPALVEQETVFAALSVTDGEGRIALAAVGQAGEVIRELADRTPSGFGNLWFGALALCPPGIPFFPAAYHDGGAPTLAVAWEVADEAHAAMDQVASLSEAERRLSERLTAVAQRLSTVMESLAERLGLRYLGLDCSLAPFPDEERSVAGLFERLGVRPFGGPGTLAVAALLTSVVQRLPVRRTGFCGLMLPVLEDARLGRLAQSGQVHAATLLAASALCGVGLDVVPLPGDLAPRQLAGIVLDVATMAVRLNKPLLARLMPIPGARAGDPVRFDFPFFAPAAALPVEGEVAADWFVRDSGQNSGEE